MMMQLVGTMAFSGAATAAGWVMWASVAPQWQRILHLACGRPDPLASPLGRLALAERRIAVRSRVIQQRASAPRRAAA